MTLSLKSMLGKLGLASLALAAATMVTVTAADARAGRGGSFGSRGANTFSAPPSTNTAPGRASPMGRTMTQPGAATAAGAAGKVAGAAQAAKPSMFRNLLLGGLIGAGLASLFGLGGGFAAILGFLLQALLIGGIIFLAIAFFRSRKAGATLPTGSGATMAGPMPNATARQAGGLGIPSLGAGAAASMGQAQASSGPLDLVQQDFETFERLLAEVQEAYGHEDLDALGDRMTPEMLSYLAGDLADNKKRGLRNKLGDVKLLQGDLSEAWREPGSEYATVAMRYEIVDALVDRSTGRVVEGDRNRPQEVTEIWTFRRNPGSDSRGWELSAIQQVA
jgi:predicted lipid-binding transport protein (Tim44 family)